MVYNREDINKLLWEFLGLVLFIAGVVVCMKILGTPGHNLLTNLISLDGKIAGFWPGLWHGTIYFFSFIFSLFTDSVNIYEVHNSGKMYNFGFVLGAGGITSLTWQLGGLAWNAWSK